MKCSRTVNSSIIEVNYLQLFCITCGPDYIFKVCMFIIHNVCSCNIHKYIKCVSMCVITLCVCVYVCVHAHIYEHIPKYA